MEVDDDDAESHMLVSDDGGGDDNDGGGGGDSVDPSIDARLSAEDNIKVVVVGLLLGGESWLVVVFSELVVVSVVSVVVSEDAFKWWLFQRYHSV